jgi:hypothetical protein
MQTERRTKRSTKALEEDKTFLEIHDEKYDFWRLVVKGSFKDELYTERARF